MLHIISGFQVAGFRHTVGCLWPSSNRVCVKVAKIFYYRLVEDEAVGSNDRAS